ncbi:transcriptional regulator domain-containing protein [Sphingobium yanoikuyae]|uniref:transcriptional regulator domain-containing protein n=1 Tax=Sphingobium yanoikuyae TaxID=13690 RepID=UPI0039C960F0
MTRDGAWRNSRLYSRLKGIDRAGLMWEWLRRDSGYIAWHAGARASTRGSADPGRWGLHFR